MMPRLGTLQLSTASEMRIEVRWRSWYDGIAQAALHIIPLVTEPGKEVISQLHCHCESQRNPQMVMDSQHLTTVSRHRDQVIAVNTNMLLIFRHDLLTRFMTLAAILKLLPHLAMALTLTKSIPSFPPARTWHFSDTAPCPTLRLPRRPPLARTKATFRGV